MFRLTIIMLLLWVPSLLINWENLNNFFIWRHQLTLISGFLGLGYMAIAMLLAMRFQWIEQIVKGLDKAYNIHKKLGIGVIVSLLFHWLIVKSGPWLVKANIIDNPNRRMQPETIGIPWRAIAEQVGDISFKIFIIFSIISLLQAISYKKFKFIHKIGGVLMIAGIFHTAFLLDWNIATVPMNITIVIISIIGIWCSWLSLSGRIGRKNKVNGFVENIKRFSTPSKPTVVNRVSIRLESKINYKEGQFVYLDFHDGESPHPFSVLNFDAKTKIIEFGIKDLGDYTHLLVNKLKIGQHVTVEGGYGFFHIPNAKQQVWIGAGIGIIPFISYLYWLKNINRTQLTKVDNVTLFYCVKSKDDAFFYDEILSIIKDLNYIDIQIICSENTEKLNGSKIIDIANSNNFDICFCGPQQFGDNLKLELNNLGIPKNRFHTELFKMR
ncbi:TPA: ferredoxin reductase family protein [Photobacterium damselae]